MTYALVSCLKISCATAWLDSFCAPEQPRWSMSCCGKGLSFCVIVQHVGNLTRWVVIYSVGVKLLVCTNSQPEVVETLLAYPVVTGQFHLFIAVSVQYQKATEQKS
jgi:hypothetical protein